MSVLLEYSDQFRSAYWLVGLRLVIVLAAAWIFGPVLAKRFGRIETKSFSTGKWPVFIAVVAFIVLFSAGMLRHLSFHSKAWDLAIFDQVIWNLANGNGWECSVRGVYDLRGDHFEPILLLFVPIYKIFPHVAWLLGAQAAALIGAGLILHATYRKKIGELPSFLFLAAFLFYPPLHWLALADFHPIALSPFFIALGWMGSRRNNLPVFLIGLLGLCLCGEEGIIVAGWWGLWEFLSRRPWRKPPDKNPGINRAFGWFGLAMLAILWAGFIYLSMVYIPSHRTEGEGYFYIHRYEYLGSSMGEIVRNFFFKPGLWISHAFDSRGWALLALYFIPLALIPFRRIGTLSLLIPTIFYTLLSVSPEQRSIFHQYTAIWIPFLFIATAEALVVYRTTASWTMDIRTNPKIVQTRLASALVVAAFVAFLSFSPIFGFSMHPELLTPEEWAAEAKGVVMSVGPDEAISAPSALCPHLSHRQMLLLQPDSEWQDIEVKVLPDFPPE